MLVRRVNLLGDEVAYVRLRMDLPRVLFVKRFHFYPQLLQLLQHTF